MKQALVLAEFDLDAIPALEALGYAVELAGWGQAHHALTEDELVALIPDVSLLVVEVERVTEKNDRGRRVLGDHRCLPQPAGQRGCRRRDGGGDRGA